jgi:hypothetical protein
VKEWCEIKSLLNMLENNTDFIGYLQTVAKPVSDSASSTSSNKVMTALQSV